MHGAICHRIYQQLSRIVEDDSIHSKQVEISEAWQTARTFEWIYAAVSRRFWDGDWNYFELQTYSLCLLVDCVCFCVFFSFCVFVLSDLFSWIINRTPALAATERCRRHKDGRGCFAESCFIRGFSARVQPLVKALDCRAEPYNRQQQQHQHFHSKLTQNALMHSSDWECMTSWREVTRDIKKLFQNRLFLLAAGLTTFEWKPILFGKG